MSALIFPTRLAKASRFQRSAYALTLIALATAVLSALPLISLLVSSLFGPPSVSWPHLAETLLWRYTLNSLVLALCVGLGVAVLGIGCAWLVASYDFPGKSAFEWLLIMPLAMPAYVIAYAYTDLLQFSGPVQGWLRELTGWQAREYWFPEIRSLTGAALMFTLVLFPYVYLPVRAAFLERLPSLTESARLLGLSSRQAFLRIALPLARPALAAGLTLVLLEVLADYGAVSYFAVETLTTGIYKTWFGLSDRVAAAQLSCGLLGLVALLLGLERASRGRARYHLAQRSYARVQRLSVTAGWAATSICAIPVVLGFVLPVLVLLQLIWSDIDLQPWQRYFLLIANSFRVAGLSALLAVVLALALGYAGRLQPGMLMRGTQRTAALGYAVPGAVMAVAIMVPLASLDNALDAFLQVHFGIGSGLLFSGTLTALVYACVVRFLAIALNNVESGLTRISPSMEEAARNLGCGPWATLWRVHIPLLWRSLAIAALLVFVDTLKELPGTLVLRPFNFDTLATQTYLFAKDERLAQAALPGLTIVMVSLAPLVFVGRALSRSSRRGGQ